MNIETIRTYCLSKKETTEGFPFDETTLVFKVNGKMFALLSLDANRLNLKCNPNKAMELREHYDAVVPAFHQNKRLWNTIVLDNFFDDTLLCEWIDDSYRLVIEKMPKKDQARLLTNLKPR